jgi:hypothetical protein
MIPHLEWARLALQSFQSGWSFIAEGMTLSPRIFYEVEKMGTFVVLGGSSLCPALGGTKYMPMDTCFAHTISN